MAKYRVGIIGCGNIFPMHAVSIREIENTELVAVCDIKEDVARKRSEEVGCKYYTDYKEMIEKEDLDVVHICTPHYLHPPMAIYAANKGINVFTEKPMSITLEDGQAMVEAAKANGVTLGVVFQNHYNAGSVLIKEMLESGELGNILSAKAIVTWNRSDEYYSKSDWKGTWDKEGGGVIIDQAIHTLDLMRWFVGDEIEYVDASIGNRGHAKIEVEDVAEGVIKYKSGIITGFFTMNYYTYDAPVEIEIHCENGLVKMIGDEAKVSLNNGREYIARPNPDETIEYGNVKSYWGTSHVKQIREYYNALDRGVAPEIDGEYALETQKMICAIYESGKNRKRIIF